ncbi:hypothetical protein AB3459_30045, partial [Pseudomonas aeruginosa]
DAPGRRPGVTTKVIMQQLLNEILDEVRPLIGRGKLLRQLLEQPALYHCEPLRQRWEAAARANLRDALERLEQPA